MFAPPVSLLDYLHLPNTRGIYAITNHVTGDIYVGKAANLRARIGQHARWHKKMREGRDREIGNVLVHLHAADAAWYPLEVFQVSVLAVGSRCQTNRGLRAREGYWRDNIGATYNVAPTPH